MPRADASRRRCAIYTRKSSEEGLEQEFNSLAAQREACEAYIRSQQHEGWLLARNRYDDGGFSGGNLERPAAQRLLTDIRAGRIDIVVVYKVDRLTRSLADFARLVELFDAEGVSFVSVTQQFNTTSSMGRLTSMFCCPLPSSSGRSPASASPTRSPHRRRRACGWAATCHSAMTRTSARSSSTLPRPKPCPLLRGLSRTRLRAPCQRRGRPARVAGFWTQEECRSTPTSPSGGWLGCRRSTDKPPHCKIRPSKIQAALAGSGGIYATRPYPPTFLLILAPLAALPYIAAFLV